MSWHVALVTLEGEGTPGEGLSASLAVGPGETLKREPSLREAEAGDKPFPARAMSGKTPRAEGRSEGER
jgi:hypothetical protein